MATGPARNVFDIHRHWYKSEQDLSGPIVAALARFFAESLDVGSSPSVQRRLVEDWVDPDGSKLLRSMDEAGISRSALVVGGFAFDLNDPTPTFRRRNAEHIELARAYPGRLTVFCGAHPGCDGIAEEIEMLAHTHDSVRGIKLDPLAGQYRLDDDALKPLYSLAQESGMPTLVHLGSRPEHEDARRAHPSALVEVLRSFPSLRIIAGHAAFEWWRELIELGRQFNSLYCDISGYQLSVQQDPGRFAVILRRLLDSLGPDRVLFGTDGPTFDLCMSSAKWAEFVQGLPGRSDLPATFTESEIMSVTSDAAASLWQR